VTGGLQAAGCQLLALVQSSNLATAASHQAVLTQLLADAQAQAASAYL